MRKVACRVALDIMAVLVEIAAAVARGAEDRLDTDLVNPLVQIVFDKRFGKPSAGPVH